MKTRAEIIVVGYQSYEFAQSLIVGEIEFLEYRLDLSLFDALIFTSKNALRSLVWNANKYEEMQSWQEIPSFVIGEGSAQAVRDFGGIVCYVSKKSHGASFAREIIPLLDQKKVLYLRAWNIVSHLDLILQQAGINLVSQITYKSKCKTHLVCQAPKKDSVLLFTSPSAYRYFKESFGWDESYLAVALGKTTYASFEDQIQRLLSPFQDIKRSIEFLRKSI
ncbi:uroporphyrinogen-III synthase [Helicobacter pametensis]|uniref:uroporphyrinogen-III synthase n=1 Tax=Helicobacter pametensis TaxID=95149 RepID=UPI000485BAAC|nr:uroporphyrinogen-III synthase [Helicobacter pametensis]